MHIGLVQEPYLRRNKVSGFKEFNVFRGAPFGKIRAAVITKKSVNAWLLNQFSNSDQVAISIKLKNKTVVMVSVYMPYDPIASPVSNILINLVKFCNEKRFEILISADANSHHTSWGSSKSNYRGEKLLEFILSSE
jgi:hypothetical protein